MFTRRFGILLLVVTAASCNTPTMQQASPHKLSGRPRTLQSSNSPASSNPFAVFRYDSSVSVAEESPSSCLTLRLQIETSVPGKPLRGHLLIDNACKRRVAILTAPVEKRLRLSVGNRFPAEVGIDQVYAIAYVFRKDVGLENDAFLGDGGFSVFTLPAYAVVDAIAKASIPLTSGVPLTLEPGSYGLALYTIAVWADGCPVRRSEIDLRNDIARFTAVHGRSRQIVLPPAAVRLAPVAFFRLE